MPSPTHLEIEKLSLKDYEIVASLLTDVFETNPAYALLFDRKKQLREGLFWVFKTNLFLLNREKTVTRIVRNTATGEILATYSMLPPSGIHTHLTDYLKIGLPRFLARFGIPVLRKIIAMDAYNKEQLETALETNDYYYLSMVAVQNTYQGKGIGSLMMKNCLDHLAATERNCNLVGLTTQLPENVTFYTRFGFEKVNEGTLYFQQNSYYNYNLRLQL